MRTVIIAAVAALAFSTAAFAEPRGPFLLGPYATCYAADGKPVPRNYCRPPHGATGVCRDGTYTFARDHHSVVCWGHGGVARWFS
jgi:hypothetical protein